MTLANGSFVMVQVAKPGWTLAALHLACAVARTNCLGLVLVKMVPVAHAGWLGTELGYQNFTEADQRLLREYAATAEAYGVVPSAELFQYVILGDAIVDAADYFDARITFATLPPYKLPLWRRFWLWRLRRQMARRGRLLYTLDRPHLFDSTLPYILVPSSGPNQWS
jgi:hypothetical protein